MWSSGIQRLSDEYVDRLDAVLCCCLTTTVGTNASTTLIARATAAQIVNIIGALILDSILLSTVTSNSSPSLLQLLCRMPSNVNHATIFKSVQGSWRFMKSAHVGALCQRQSSRHFWLEEDLDTWKRLTDRRTDVL